MSHTSQIEKLHQIVLEERHGFEPNSLDYLPTFLESMADNLGRLPTLTGIPNEKLDFSVASLELVEAWILNTYPTQEDFNQPAEVETVVALSCYAGETLRRAVPGSKWMVQLKPDITAYGRPIIWTPDGRQFSPIGFVSASTCSWRREGNYIRDGVARRIELNSPSHPPVEDPVPAAVDTSSGGVAFSIRLYDPSVKSVVESGVPLQEVPAPALPASAWATLGSLLTHYGYKAQGDHLHSHEVLGNVTHAANVFTFRIPYSDDYESAVMDASMAATEIAHDLGLSVYFPFDGTWAELE